MSQQQQVNQFQAPASSTGGEPAIQTQEEMQNLLFNHNAMNQLYNLAQVMASGKSTVPQHLQGNAGDCMAVVMQAAQWRMNPFAVAQKTHLVSGTLGYEAQLVNAVITTMAPTTGRLQYEWFGPWEKILGKFIDKQGQKGTYKAPGWKSEDEADLGVRVWATIKGEEHPRVLELLLTQAQTRNSTLWASDPKQQLAYLATKRWARLHTPDVIMGVYTPDEMEGYGTDAGERDVTPKPQSTPGAQPLPNTAQARTRAKLAEKRNANPAAREPEPVAEEQPVENHGEITADMVCAQINKAVTSDEMAEAIDLARHVPEADKATVNAAYKARIAELKQPSQQK